MKKLKIKSKLISLEEQLEILERAKIEALENNWGLCIIIFFAIVRIRWVTGNHSYCLHCKKIEDIVLYIPLFTRENAVKYFNAENFLEDVEQEKRK